MYFIYLFQITDLTYETLEADSGNFLNVVKKTNVPCLKKDSGQVTVSQRLLSMQLFRCKSTHNPVAGSG